MQLQALEYYLASSPNIPEALRLLTRRGGLFGSEAPFSVEELPDAAILLRFIPTSPATPRCIIEFVVGILHLFGRSALDARERSKGALALRAWFAYPPPDCADEYRSFFDGAVVFSAPFHGLWIDSEVLGAPMSRSNPPLQRVLGPYVDGLAQPRVDAPSLAGRARALIAETLPENGADVQTIAKRLHMSRTTLKRKLAEESTTLRALIHDVRVSLAIERLESSDTSISEIAFLVGYSDVTSFHKAFKQWTGHTPAEIRANAHGSGDRPAEEYALRSSHSSG